MLLIVAKAAFAKRVFAAFHAWPTLIVRKKAMSA